MTPLAEALESAEDSYPFVRCGGLFQAMMELVGGENLMGEQTWARMNATRETLIISAVLIRQMKYGSSVDHHTPRVIIAVRNIADLYTTRMESNYAAGGKAFGQDNLILGDLTICGAVAEEVRSLK